jgi:hypothetical protein
VPGWPEDPLPMPNRIRMDPWATGGYEDESSAAPTDDSSAARPRRLSRRLIEIQIELMVPPSCPPWSLALGINRLPGSAVARPELNTQLRCPRPLGGPNPFKNEPQNRGAAWTSPAVFNKPIAI